MQNRLNILTTVILSLMPVFALAQAKNVAPPVLAQTNSQIKPLTISLHQAPTYITASGKVIDGRVAEAAEDAQMDKEWAHFRRGRADLLIDDYSNAIVEFRKALEYAPNDEIYMQHLAYAMLGDGDKADALRLLHDSLYYAGRNLYTSGFMMKPYTTYALLEDEAGNWKEAALAYDLAGGGPKGKYFNGIWPNVEMNFTANHPEPMLLAAAANVMLGKCSWDAHDGETGNAAFSDALKYMRTATRLEPRWPVGWYYLSLVLGAAKHPHQSDEAYKRALSLAGSVRKLLGAQHPPVDQQLTMIRTRQ